MLVPFEPTASYAGGAWLSEEGRSMPQGPQLVVKSNNPKSACFPAAPLATHTPTCKSGAVAPHTKVESVWAYSLNKTVYFPAHVYMERYSIAKAVFNCREQILSKRRA